MIRLVTEDTSAADTLWPLRVITIPVGQAADAFRPAVDTERCIPATARVVRNIAEGTGVVHALLTVAVPIT